MLHLTNESWSIEIPLEKLYYYTNFRMAEGEEEYETSAQA